MRLLLKKRWQWSHQRVKKPTRFLMKVEGSTTTDRPKRPLFFVVGQFVLCRYSLLIGNKDCSWVTRR